MYIKIFLLSVLSLIFLFDCNKSEDKENKNKEEIKTTEKKENDDGIISLSQEAIKLAEIQSKAISYKSYQNNILTTGVVKEVENSIFKVTSAVGGKITYDGINISEVVKKGQKIAEVQNIEVVKIYSNYIHEYHNNELMIKQAKIKLKLAKNTFERESNMLKQGISSKKEYLQAKTDYELNQAEISGLEEHRTHLTSEAKALLSNYGTELGNPESERINSSSPIFSPKNGVITKKNIFVGNIVLPDQTLYEISDLSKVYIDINIYGKDINSVKIGHAVSFISDSLAGKNFQGKISYLNPSLNKENQTFTAKVILNNKENLLKLGMFGKVVIKEEKENLKPHIIENSLQTYNKENFVFIDLGNGKYKKTVITLDKKFDNGYLIKKGIKKGDKVVTQGTFTLKSELLKNQFSEEE